MGKAKKILTNWRVILLIVCLLFALWTIRLSPQKEGVAIRSVAYNSSVNAGGIENPKPNVMPMSREVILAIDNQLIKSTKDYFDITEELMPNTTATFKTNKGLYSIYIRPTYNVTVLDELEEYEAPVMINVTETIDGEEVVKLVPKTEIITKIVERTVIDSETGEPYTVEEEVNETITITETKTKNKIHREIIGKEDLGLAVYPAPTSNIKKGLDLAGGTRVILAPEEQIEEEQLVMLVDIIKNRLNIYGLSDISVRPFTFGEEKYVIVEIAGASKQEVVDLLGQQGKFEARISNETVFFGNEITYICTDPSCNRVTNCGEISSGQWSCKYDFSIKLSADAAKSFSEATKDLDIVDSEGGRSYLSEQIIFYLDESEVDALQIDSKLRGAEAMDISISGPGYGKDKTDAYVNTKAGQKKLITYLKTGSLPVKLNIENSVVISAIAGEQFVKNSLKVGIYAILAVAVVIFVIYRKLRITIPLLLTSFSEVILLLGLAALMQELDFAAIAGIIIVVGTGVDHLIVITDEVLRGEGSVSVADWKKRFKAGFMIILISFFTTSVAMIPLIFAGAGLLRGFAIITIFGLGLGIFVSRPAYGAVIEILMRE